MLAFFNLRDSQLLQVGSTSKSNTYLEKNDAMTPPPPSLPPLLQLNSLPHLLTSVQLLRSSLVNSQVQATVARDLGLDEYINFGKKVSWSFFYGTC